ncbi:MAG: nicotinate (nicotinamide) nucleotide adenylyltransferase [Planctomycetota bacterium]|jgi:nicotinate-nucleotide adenylyltransferase
MASKRIGIFGGSFDPIHLGHLLMAEQFRSELSLDTVKFIPAKISPFKLNYTPTADKHRLEMLKLAIGAHPNFEIDPIEIQRGGVSYTIDTVEQLQSNQPDATWFLLIGADSLKDFKKWKSPEKLLRSVQLVVARRGGCPEPDWKELDGLASEETLRAIQQIRLDIPVMEISSTAVRQRIETKRSIRYLVPAPVEVYIQEHQLYLPPEASPSETSAGRPT